MDAGTIKDYIEDLMLRVKELEGEVRFWREAAQQAMANTDKALEVIELHKAIRAVQND